MRNPVRGAWRRRIASMLAAATIGVGIVGVVGTQPAQASSCVNGAVFFGSDSFYDPVFCYDEWLRDLLAGIGTSVILIPAPPPVAPTPLGLEAKPALDEAGVALNNDRCNSLITGGFNYPTGEFNRRRDADTDALSLIADEVIIKIIPIEALSTQDPEQAARAVIDNGPGRDFDDAPQGIGKEGSIVIFMPVFREISMAGIEEFILEPGAQEFVTKDGRRVPVPDDVLKAVALLHELAHLTGGNDHVGGDPDREFNRNILEFCFSYDIARFAPPPPPPSRPGDGTEYQEP